MEDTNVAKGPNFDPWNERRVVPKERVDQLLAEIKSVGFGTSGEASNLARRVNLRKEYNAKKYNELRTELKNFGLHAGGPKKSLVDRLVNHIMEQDRKATTNVESKKRQRSDEENGLQNGDEKQQDLQQPSSNRDDDKVEQVDVLNGSNASTANNKQVKL